MSVLYNFFRDQNKLECLFVSDNFSGLGNRTLHAIQLGTAFTHKYWLWFKAYQGPFVCLNRQLQSKKFYNIDNRTQSY